MPKASQMLIRMHAPLKAALESAARGQGRSTSAEIVRRLELSLEADAQHGGPEVGRVIQRMVAAFLHGGELGTIARGLKPGEWVRDRVALQVAIAAVIDELRGIEPLAADMKDPKAVERVMTAMIARGCRDHSQDWRRKMSGHIRERGAGGSWELRYELPRSCDGKRRTRTETFHGTKKAAAARLRELMTSVDRGEHVDANKISVAQHVRARVEQWRAAGRVSPSTHEHYEQLAALIVAHLGDVTIQKLTTLNIERWHAALRAKGLSAPVIRHAHDLLSRALSDAVRHNLLVRNIAREQKPHAGRSPEVAIITADQIKPLLAKLEGSELYVPAVVALYCGVRRAEQLAARWRNVDLDGAKLHVVEALEETRSGLTVKTPKTATGRRTISLPAVVVDALRAHRRAQLEQRLLLGLGKPSDDALVFPGIDGRHQSPRAFSMAWRRATRRLGLPAVHWHALRHTHASMLIAAGVDVVTVSRRLGHSKPDVTLRVYSHLFAADDSAAAAAIDRALG